MKNTRTGQRTIRKLLKGAGSAILLATLLVLVFAGTLSGAFGIEENLQQNGIIESNVADAEFNKIGNDGTIETGTDYATAIGSYTVWKRVHVATWWGGDAKVNCTFTTGGILRNLMNSGLCEIRLTYNVSIVGNSGNLEFSVRANDSNGTQYLKMTSYDSGTHTSSWVDISTSQLYFYFQNHGSSTKESEVKDIGFEIRVKTTAGFSGSGTSASPFLLENRADFDLLAYRIQTGSTYVNQYFKVQPDNSNSQNGYIDMLGGNASYGAYTPGGLYDSTSHGSFRGHLDGNNVQIRNLVISVGTDTARAALIGTAGDGAVISNVHIASGSSVSSLRSDAAGVVGFATGTVTISGCKNYASVYSPKQNGGIVANAGGSGNVTISGCQNYGTITGKSDVGGIVGIQQGICQIENCTNIGSVGETIDLPYGGLNSGSTYKIVQVDGGSASGEGFDNLTDGNVGTKYCSAKKNAMSFIIKVSSSVSVSGFSITNANDTAANSSRRPGTVKIWGANTNDRTTNYTDNDNGGSEATSGWASIYNGNGATDSTDYKRFTHNFSSTQNYNYYWVYIAGSGKVQLSEFALRVSADNSGGIVGHAKSKTNVKQSSNTSTSKINGDNNVGGIVGYADGTSSNKVVIDSAVNSGAVTGNNNVGGIVGGGTYASLTTSATNSGSIKGVSAVGGIVGCAGDINASNKGFSITNASNTGTVTSTGGEYVGGISGYSRDTSYSGTISNEGNISASKTEIVGGVVGYLFGGTLTSATNSGTVKGNNHVGGIAGVIEWGQVNGATNSGQVSGNSNVGGIAGRLVRNADTSNGTAIQGTLNNTGCVSGTDAVGGIIGRIESDGNATFDWNATVNIASSALGDGDGVKGRSYVGGAIGYLSAKVTVQGSIDISGNDVDSNGFDGYAIGGIVGYNAGTIKKKNTSDVIVCAVRVIGRGSSTVGSITYNGNTYSGSIIGGIVGFNVGTIDGATRTNKANGNALDVISTSSRDYLGGIAGVNLGTLKNCENTSTYVGILNTTKYGGQYVGGVVGYNTGSVEKCKSTSTVNGTNYVGGFIGYNAYVDGDGNGITIDGYTNNSQVSGTNYVGGIIGGVANNTTVTNSTNKALVKGSYYVGGIVGGLDAGKLTLTACVNDNADSKTTSGTQYVGGILGGIIATATSDNCEVAIENCSNTQDISATSNIGGILGGVLKGKENIKAIAISKTFNSGTISSGTISSSDGNMGGIVGRAYSASSADDSIYIHNCYNVGTINHTYSTGDSVGGIVGYLYASGTNANAARIEYCFNNASVTGQTCVAGIVGGGTSSGYFTVDHCYVLADSGHGISFRSDVTSGKIGAIVGGAFDETNVSNYKVTNSWGFLALNADNQKFNNLGKVLFTDLTVTPQIIENNVWKDVAWTDILEKGINGFKVTGTTGAGKYASSIWGNTAKSSAGYVYTNVATPSSIWVNSTANGTGVAAQTNCAIEFAFYYDASYYYANEFNGRVGVRVEVKDIVSTAKQTKEYNSQNQVITNPTTPQITTESAYAYGIIVVYFDDAAHTQNPTTDGKTQAGTYYYIADITLGEKVVGRYLAEFEITPYDFANKKFNEDYWFGANDDVIVTNQDKTRIEDEMGNKIADLFLLNKNQTERPQALIYQGADSYTQNNFVLYIKYTIIGADGVAHTVVKQCDEFEITEFVSALGQNEHVREGTKITAQGKDGSVVGEIKRYYTLLDSDFGWSKNTEGAGTWGTKDNPYVISTQAQLMRLSQILNGDKAWNSINSDNQNVVLAKDTRSVATDKTYSGAYFVVTNDIHLDGTFKPVGNADIPFKAKSFASNTDGTLVTISYFYNDTTTDYVYRDYVGLFGNAEGTHFKDLLVWGGTYNGGTSYTGKQIIGQHYVGGLVGKMVGGIVENCTFTSNVGGASIIGQDYVGGLIGYASGTQVLYDTSDANMRNNDNLVNARVTGVNYVGGIIGQWIITSASQFNNGNANGLYFATTANNIVTSTGSYAGAIAGALDASGCADNLEIKAKLNVYPKNAPQKAQVHGVNYVGALYGSFIGGGTDKTTVTYNDTDVWATIEFGGRVVGGFIGYLQAATLKFNKNYDIDNKSIMFEASSGKTPSFFGGVVGVLGKGANIAGAVLDKNNKTFPRITNSVDFGKDYKYGDFVGGIVGYVSSGAGRSNMGSTIFGDDLVFVGQGEIHATNYVGGIFGAIGIIDGYTTDDTLLFNTIRYGSNTNVSNANIVTFKPSSAKNVSGIYGTNNVGGLVGGVFKKALIYLENAVTNANNPTFDVSNSANVIGTQYVGGIVGYLEQESHVLNRVVNTGVIGATNASYVGGLVGYMIGGTISNSVSASKAALTYTTNLYLGSKYVGGLVGFMQGGSLENSLSTGFKFDGNNTSITKGGVVGDKLSPIIEGSWTIYIATAPTYSTVSLNKNGKYVLIDGKIVSEVGRFEYLLAMAGITTQTTYIDYYIFKQGELLLGVNYPYFEGESATENQPQQLAFYDVSGADSVMTTHTTVFTGASGVLRIGVSMADGESYSICKCDVLFKDIAKFTKEITDQEQLEKEKKENAQKGYRAPSGASNNYRAEVTTALYDNGGNITRIIANIYFKDIIIGSVEGIVGNYDSGKLAPGSSDATALTISTQAEWNDFAWQIYTGQNEYKGKYVKLLTDITIERKASHTGTNGANYNFDSECDWNTKSRDRGWDVKNAVSNKGYNFAGNIAVGADGMSVVTVADVDYTNVTKVTPSFKGHFDGNGHKITVNYDGIASGVSDVNPKYQHRVSVFPNAGFSGLKTSFKNLTIEGSIRAATYTGDINGGTISCTNGAYDIAGFVGKPYGAIKFENCTNAAKVTGLRVISGIAGCSTETAPLELIGCVNKGDITSYQMSDWKAPSGTQELGNQYDYQYGTGGIIAYATSTITIESCLNTGNITGGAKIGGLVGRVTNKNNGLTKLVINNSANTGSIWSFEYNPFTPTDNKKRGANVWARAGGLVGEVDYYTQAFIYASYNTGNVSAVGNLAGGIVGIIGTIPGADSGKDKPGYTETKYASTIAYCYNTGKVTVGYKDNEGIPFIGSSGNNFNGSNAGGIVGTTGGVNISYCYNTGTIHAKGGVGGKLAWHTRNGGIVGEITTHSTNGNLAAANISNCYNTGLLHFTESNNTDARYGADIVGYLETKTDKVKATNCYGVKNSILLGEDGKGTYKSGWNDTQGSIFTFAPDKDFVRTGTTLDSFASLTAVMKSTASVGTIQSLATSWDASVATIDAQDNANYQTGSLSGYIYMPGCLPQLAVFAVDTYNGLSMNSQNYGYDDNYGGYRSQNAGDKYSPYVIRDGIDLLGLQALVDLGFTFDGKYVEFANGTNNITTDQNISSDTARVINMPTDGTSARPSATAAYKFSSKSSPSLSTAADWKTGKSYHLYSLGGVCAQDRNTSNNTYDIWKAANHAYKSSNSTSSGATFANQNFIPIGRKGGNNIFKGNISGAQADGNTKIANLRITYRGNAGLFGYVQDAEVRNITVSGNVYAYSGGSMQRNRSVAGGIVAFAYGSTIIDGCEAGTSNWLNVYAYGQTSTYDNNDIGNVVTSAGAIVGEINTARYMNSAYEYQEGAVATISNNRTVYADVRSAKNRIGGIVGFATGASVSHNAEGKNNKIEIVGNTVDKAWLFALSATDSTNSDVGTKVGGIIGYSDKYISILVRDCVVGVQDDTTTVRIEGENRIGGIVGEMPEAVGEIIGCKVLKSATIKRASNWGKVTNADESGTAIGGIVGLTYNASGTDPITTTFSGNIVFKGKIVIAVGTHYISASNSANDGVVRNVGGIVGDMGAGARIATGSEITVRGTIDISASTGANYANRNIGGVAGRTNDVAFSGKFDVAPTITAKTAYQVGGFIGKNNGIVNILADDTDIRIGGNISASHDVGGFIGYNAEGHTLLIGADQYRAVNYNGALLINIVQSVTDAEKKADINTLISASGDNVGGIVGNSEQNGVVKIVKGTIVNVGQVTGQDNVGGIIGINDGNFSTGGSVYGNATLEIVNEGKVNGNDFVGGVIGKLNIGQIAGRFINRGNVSGRDYVGGSIGYVAKEASILSTSAGKTEFINEAVAIAGQSDALVASDATTADDSKFNVTGNNYVGGSIGLLLGMSLGNENYKVEFRSKGTVNGNKYVGGSIGVLAGKTEYTDFISEGEMTGVGATTAVGGSVGFIGVPNPLTEAGGGSITASDVNIVVSHTHFEANGTLTLNDTNGKPEGVGEYVWGGIGGAIGAIGNATDNLFDNSLNNRWTNNTYYASGNVTAKGFFHVGGIVGLIKADNITIENMLAYDTKVTGGKNVGGIVGATIGKKTVINSAFSISTNENGGIFTAPQGNAGGIIGFAQEDTDASTSYWVKGYTNAELAGSSVTNLKTTLGRYTLAYEVYALDGKEVTVVFTKELIGTGTATGEGGETADEEVAIYPTPYAYYESVGTHTVKTYDAKTQKYVDVTYTVDPEEATAKGYTLIEEDLTWQDYFDMTFGTVKVGTVERSRITYQKDVGAWVEEKSSWTEYSTGTKQTGWYFVYANDQQGGNNQIGKVDAVHSTSATEGYSDLWYWKRIANAYTMDERNAGYDDDSKANSPYAHNPLNSAIVREITKGETADDDTVSTVPHKGTLYATATAANFKNNPSASGYYMYIASSGNTKPTSVNYDGKFFIQAEGGVSQNVAVYYRSIAMGSALTYNGYERYAPISLSGDIKYDESVSVNNNDNNDDNTDKKNLYFYNTVNKDATTPKIPNTYYTTVYVYYFDDEGKPYVVGGINEGVWRIKERSLTFSATDVNGKVYGDEDIETTITITDIALADINDIVFTLTIEGLSNPITIDLKNGAKFEENQGVTFGVVNVIQTSEVKLKGNDTKYNLKNLSASDRETGKLTFNIRFKNAKNYKLSVGLKNTIPSKYYTLQNANKQINVEKKALAIKHISGKSAVVFDNQTHGISWEVDGFVYGENLSNIASLLPKIYADVDGDTNDYTTALTNNGEYANTITINTSSGGRASTIVVEVMKETNLIKLTGAKLKGTYYLAFDKQEADDCNYKFTTADNKVSEKLIISDNMLTVEWGSETGHTYNKEVGLITAIVTAKDPINNLADFVKEYFVITGKVNINKSVYNVITDKEKVKITFETNSYNADTYSVTLKKSDKILEIDCNYTIKDKRNTKTYKITQRTLAFTYQMTSSGNLFEYNSYHQGLKSVTVSNICKDDSVQLGIGGDVTVAQSGKSNGTTITVSNGSNETKGTIDVGSYSAYVTKGTNTVSKNYTLPSDCTYSWDITKKSLSISGLTAQDVTYDGQEHRPNPTLNGATSQGNGVYKFGQDTIEINYKSGNELSKQSFVNAAKYTISINMSQKVVAKHDGGADASKNYETTINGGSETTFEIKAREITLTWTNNALVYSGPSASLGQTIATVTADDGKVFTFVSSSITSAKFKGYAGNDTITFKIGGAQANAGAGQMTASIDSVTGKNADNKTDSAKENYNIVVDGIVVDESICGYNINKMKVSVKYSSGRIADKVYDATNVVKNLNGLSFAIGSTNAKTTFRPKFSDVYTVSAVYTSSNVGDWQLTLKYAFIGGANYEQEGELSETTSDAVGKITPATITVTLDRLRNGRATRTFAEDKNGNISVYYGGANGAINGQRSNRSQTYRLGEGFTIDGFPSAEAEGVVRVLAKYVEVGTGRSDFNGYVNYIYDSGNNVFVKGTATSAYVVKNNLYKALEFSIEDVVKDSGKSANYRFHVVDSSSSKATISGDSDAQLGTNEKPVRVYDTADTANKNVGKQTLSIEITVKTYKIKYGNTTQSYANSDGSYNKEWLPVEAIDLPSGINVDVKNGWMYDESGQPHKIYKQYTVIRGKAGSAELSASVTGEKGKQLNYNMTNQPVLTIGYFVEENSDTFEIGSLSSLLIASYYWWVSANSGDPEFNQVINTRVTWNALISDANYDGSAKATIPEGAPVPTDKPNITWDEYFLWLETEEGGKHIVFLNENENNTWGYYTTTTGAGEVKKYSSFKQVRDINGTFTQSDIEMLNGFFRTYDPESEKYNDRTWGKGGEFITNFLKVGEGNVAVAIGSIFKSLENGFTGAYDGGGYVIEYFNIMSFDGAENVGMFDVLGITANVKNLHLRNFTINAGAGNVGGIAGKALAGENAIENVSWHGTISMSGSGNVGGLIGVSARSINKAIALGTINAKGGNIGGLIGSIEQGASVAISNAVSFVYVEAMGSVSATIASATGVNESNVFYLASSAWKRNGSVLTSSDGTYGTAKTYTQLMQGSVSGYSVSGSEYYRYAGTKLGGDFDMLDDFNYSEQTTENIQKMNARQSLRLKDIVDVYMLMYDVKETNASVVLPTTIKVYTISSSSWLVGNKHGVDGDEIEIGNRQQVALLRELRFASFVLTSDVVATATSGGVYAYGGAFFGKVTVVDGKSYKIDFGSGKRAFEAHATGSDVPHKRNV